MKIAYITNTAFARSESFVRDLAVGLSKGHQVRLFANEVNDEGHTHPEVNPIQCGFFPPEPLHIRLYRQILERSGGDSHAWNFARKVKYFNLRTESLLRNYGPDVIYADFGTMGVLVRKFAKAHQIPLFVHFHGYDASSALTDKTYLKELGKLMDDAAGIVVPSKHIERLLRIATGTTRHIACIPCGPNLSLVKQIKAEVPQSLFRIVALGRLTPKKNPLALIEAFRLVLKSCPQAELHWIGDGELRADVETRISKHGLDTNISLYGVMPHKEALAIMATAQVFVQHSVTAPSGDQEGLPVAILEALAMGIPVVSTIHSGIPEAVQDQVNGFLVREHDFVSMSRKIIEVIDGRYQFDTNSFDEKCFSLDVRIDKISAMLNGTSSLRKALGSPI